MPIFFGVLKVTGNGDIVEFVKICMFGPFACPNHI